MCTSAETEFTTTSMTAVSVSTRIAQETSRSPDVTHRMSVILSVAWPTPTCQKATHESTAASTMNAEVTNSDGRGPMTRPKKPAISAPSSGEKTMA